MRIKLEAMSLENGYYEYSDYDITFDIEGEGVKKTQRASVWAMFWASSGNLNNLKRVLDGSPYKDGLLRFQDKDDQSLLSLAVKNGHKKVVKYLLEAGSDVDVTDAKGRTPLMEAALWGHLKIVNILLGAGSDAAQRDQRGMRAADLAEESDRNDLERHKRALKYSEDPFVKKRDRRLIRALLKHLEPTSIPRKFPASDLEDAYFYKSPQDGKLSLIIPGQEQKTLSHNKTAAILLRGDSLLSGSIPPIFATSGWLGPSNREFRRSEEGLEMLNQGYWAHESLQIAKNIGFSFEPHALDVQGGCPGIYNACHAEAQAMCYFVKKNYIFRDYKGQSDVDDDFLQLFMLQPRNRRAMVVASKDPCSSCKDLRDWIFQRLGICFIFAELVK
ncbi:hypothetical protein GGI43DRAFT_398908 [Trichoderma evansii]